ncbi:MAG: HAD-IA family hydrolase [Acidobacteria bacterium]|nr:HAD-IA family hydrolase [Acidobacteriota bacterium]MBS1864901.1 HAD-IA family hydrolase [Acidobacteriota bacterium]
MGIATGVLQFTDMTAKKELKAKALVFDLDGTLIDSKMDLVNSVNATLRELKREALPTGLVASYVGSGAPTLIRKSLGGNPSDEELKRALAFFLVYYEEHKLDETRLYRGVKETLGELKSLPMSVLTNKPVKMSVHILEELGVAQYFRCIYGGNSFTTKKPDPEGANRILSELRVNAKDAAMVGDSEVDVQTARNAGMASVCVNFGFGTHDRGAHPADVYINRFEELLKFADSR